MSIVITSNLAYVETQFGKFVSAIPELMIVLPRVAAPPVMGVLMAAVRLNTPIDTGQLVAETDWEETGQGTEKLEAVIFSAAENDRTGFHYAKARAYGFNTVAGYFWTPPEDPPYPLQAVQDAQDVLADAARPEIQAAVMAVFAIPI